MDISRMYKIACNQIRKSEPKYTRNDKGYVYATPFVKLNGYKFTTFYQNKNPLFTMIVSDNSAYIVQFRNVKYTSHTLDGTNLFQFYKNIRNEYTNILIYHDTTISDYMDNFMLTANVKHYAKHDAIFDVPVYLVFCALAERYGG